MKIWTNYLDEAALSKTGIEVYYHAYDTPPVDYFKKAATISTNGSGNASGSSITVDSYDGEEEYYYFKFTRNGVDYKSETVTLAELADGTSANPAEVTCNAQIMTFTIKAYTLKFGELNGKSVVFKVGSPTATGENSISKTTGTGGGNKGYITSDFTITCKPNTPIYITANNSALTRAVLITEIGDRTTELNMYALP